MLWINFLHLYQPANTDAYHIKEATDKCYLRIIRALEERPLLRFTMNINGCLFLRWEELGYQYLIARLKNLIERGQLEITGNAAYHPLLPLIPKKEAERQIKETEEMLRKHFGGDNKPKGFYFSEMAYSAEMGQLIKSLGYEWIILDEISHNGNLNKTDCSRTYMDQASGLKVIFRQRSLSNTFVPKSIAKTENSDKTIITATDGELYGLRYIDHTGSFEKSLDKRNLRTMTISEYIGQNTEPVKIALAASSWESTPDELADSRPYALWHDERNKIQNDLWSLAHLAYQSTEDYQADPNAVWARWHLVRGLASCAFWWASGKDFKESFGPLAWNPDEIERGINELIRAIRALEGSETRELKIKAEKKYIDLKRQVWELHWAYYWKKNIIRN